MKELSPSSAGSVCVPEALVDQVYGLTREVVALAPNCTEEAAGVRARTMQCQRNAAEIERATGCFLRCLQSISSLHERTRQHCETAAVCASTPAPCAPEETGPEPTPDPLPAVPEGADITGAL